MSSTQVTFADPERVCVDVLNAAFGVGAASTDYPSETLAAAATHIQVDLEGGPLLYPVVERAQVRITAHCAPGKRTAVKALADEARHELAAYVGSSTVASITPLPTARSAVSTDPSTKNLMCWFLVRVNLKGQVVL